MRRIALCLIAAQLLLVGCATNPVTGRSELAFVSTAQEISIGEEQYEPSRQMQGGDYVVEPSVTAYVQEVGQRVAAKSDRPLPYEFHVLNSSVPNAWALPGGKIAINRGLLTELDSEAELAAVLGHEVVHAAARHGAKSMERGMLVQGALLAVAVTAADNDFAPLIVGGAQVGAQLITTAYGRGAELESDLYGMQYMAEAGYNPQAAVQLQETFVRLSDGRQSDWLSGLFATHPPAQERVERNEETAVQLGDIGDFGRDRYLAAMKPLLDTEEAYAAYDKGVAALHNGDARSAASLARQALAIEPREAKFHELLGDVETANKRPDVALDHYNEAVSLNPEYFQSYLKRGNVHNSIGNFAAARSDLERSVAMLPTASAYNSLGIIARQDGRDSQAKEYFQAAASSDSDVGRAAGLALVEMDLPSNPQQYVQTGIRLNDDGMVVVITVNRAPVPVTNIRGNVVVLDPSGQRVQVREPFTVSRSLDPKESAGVVTGLGPVSDSSQLSRVRIELTGAQVAR